jgi:hypothetical protein
MMFRVCDNCDEVFDEGDIVANDETGEFSCPHCGDVFDENKVEFDTIFCRARMMYRGSKLV